MPTQTIDLRTGSDAVEYTWPLTITERTGKDISAVPIELSLGTWTAPGDWRTPDADPPQPDQPSQRVVQLLIGAAYKPDAGTYRMWSRPADDPEIAPRPHDLEVRILTD